MSYRWDELIDRIIAGEVLLQGPLDRLLVARELSRTTRLTRRLLGAFLQIYFGDGGETLEPSIVKESDSTIFLFETDDSKVSLEEESI
ncbi:MAG: hypothetical protein H7Y17_13090 [Chlorobia bacterium]|nr:hypothetical protein [Fimbriimonadaceae bacterium]